MKDPKWMLSRLKAMSPGEILWRLQSKAIRKWEKRYFYKKNEPVCFFGHGQEFSTLINPENLEYTMFSGLTLLGNYSYQDYRLKWHAGYQTEKEWPADLFSYDIPIGSREDIGDIRTNWELNRHQQFAGLAKNYLITGDGKWLKEFRSLFDDWNEHNCYLHGVQWSSAMEVALRGISWIYTLSFLKASVDKYGTDGNQTDRAEMEKIFEQMTAGLEAMTRHVLRNRSRYSSANNHLIIELAEIGLAGCFLNRNKWVNLAITSLTEELIRQNYPDGVNREMSLHYQAFVMEAYGLLGLVLQKQGYSLPQTWTTYLHAMSRFLSDSCGDYGEAVCFGDCDEGRILDLTGDKKDYYAYVLQLMGMLLGKRYTKKKLSETVLWITSEQEQKKYSLSELYQPQLISHYSQGGYTLLRSRDRKILIGFDHGELGFGSLAAHGHADALSLQIFTEGKPFLLDPGTGSYHVPKVLRDQMRTSMNHNTVYMEGLDQARMNGPFLWGKRYEILPVELVTACDEEGRINSVTIAGELHYQGTVHKREISFDFHRRLEVTDQIEGCDPEKTWLCWCLPLGETQKADAFTKAFDVSSMRKEEIPCSSYYNRMETAVRYMIPFEDSVRKTVIDI